MDPITAALIGAGIKIGTEYLMKEIGGGDSRKQAVGAPPSGQWTMRQSIPLKMNDTYQKMLMSILGSTGNNPSINTRQLGIYKGGF